MIKTLVVYVGFVAAERVLYLPSVGFCLLVAFGFQRCVVHNGRRPSLRSRALLVAAAAVLVASLSCRTLLRNRDWYDEERLYRSAITINPPKGLFTSFQSHHYYHLIIVIYNYHIIIIIIHQIHQIQFPVQLYFQLL